MMTCLAGAAVEPSIAEKAGDRRVVGPSRFRNPDAAVAQIAAAETGPEMAAALTVLDLAGLSAGGLLDAAAAWHRVAAWVAAQELAAVHAFTQRCAEARDAELEIACALHLSAFAADTLITEAAALACDLPATRAALEAGRISARHAAAVVEAVTVSGLDVDAAAVVEIRALRHADTQNVAQLRRVLARAVQTADPAAAERRHADRAARRHVRLAPAGDGMAVYAAELEAVAAAKLAATVTDHAKTLQANDKVERAEQVRTLDAARADALCELVAFGAAAVQSGAPQKTTVETTIHVTVPMAVLLGLEDGPADLSGHGPVTAAQARAAAHAAGATWRRLVTDDASGTVLDVGRTRYRPGPAIADTVRAAHPRCLFPACSRPAAGCDLDHRDPFDRTGHGHGGPTAADNLGPLCRFHHNAKTHHGWTWTVQPTTGDTIWTSPTGHTYTDTSHREHTA
jgi:hypothetical protein